MKRTNGKMIKVAALTAAVMLTAVAAPVGQGVFNAAVLTANAAYGETDTNYTKETQGNLTYYKYSDHIEVYDVTSGTTSVTIPSSIGGLPVTAVARYGFQCSDLTSITLPDSIKTIGYYAFAMSSNLTSVTLPSSLETMEMHCFELCSKLDTVNFPSSLVKIHTKCFDSTPWLSEQKANNTLVIINGALFDASKASGDFVVPSNVKYVCPGAFSRNSNITSVVFPNGVTEVGDDTFFYCTNLRSVELPSVKSIGATAFCDCQNLRELKVSGDLSDIHEYAFLDTNTSPTITFYGSSDKWNSINKPNCAFFNNATVVFDESHYVQPQVSPRFSKIEYSSQYHQIRFSWNKIDGATNYGIAVKLAGKWRVQGGTLSGNTFTYTTPKNLTPGKSYQVALGAKINGEWTVNESVKNAVTVTVR